MPWNPRPPSPDAPLPWPIPGGGRPPGEGETPAAEPAPQPAAEGPPRAPQPPDMLLRTDFHNAARRNRVNTRWLIAALLAIGAVLGYLIGWVGELMVASVDAPAPAGKGGTLTGGLPLLSVWGLTTAAIVVAVGGVWSFVALRWGDRIVLRLNGAREVAKEDEPVLFNVVEEMSIAAGIPMPKVAIVETKALNAFATGLRPETATIGVTRGLLAALSRDELQGVVAHEAAHIVNNDVRFMTAVGVLVGLIAGLSHVVLRMARVMMHAGGRGAARAGGARIGGGGGSRGGGGGAVILLAILVLLLVAAAAPFAARLLKYALSRQREFLADATAARLTRYPQGLIGALRRISDGAAPAFDYSTATRHMYIADPEAVAAAAKGKRSSAWNSTHPPIEDRIERLRNLG